MGSGKGQSKRVKNVTIVSKYDEEFKKSLAEVEKITNNIDQGLKSIINKMGVIDKQSGLDVIYNGIVIDKDALSNRVKNGARADEEIYYATFNSRMNEVNDGTLYDDLSILDLNPNVSAKAMYYWSTDEGHGLVVPDDKVRRDVIIRPFGEKLMVMDYVIADVDGCNVPICGFKQEVDTASAAIKLANERRDLALVMADQLDEAIKPGRLRVDVFRLDDLNDKLREYSSLLINDPSNVYSEGKRSMIIKKLGRNPLSSVAASVEFYDQDLEKEFGRKLKTDKPLRDNLKGISSTLSLEKDGKVFKSKKLKKAREIRAKYIKEVDDVLLKKWGVYTPRDN